MTFNSGVLITSILLSSALAAGSIAIYYRSNAIIYQGERDKATDALQSANAKIDDMQVRQRDVAALDAKYTRDLADAQATIDQLHDDVATGKRRLLLNVKRHRAKATGTSCVDDAASPRSDDALERNYFTLRRRIEVAGKQIAGLQQYINQQCLK